MFLGKLSKKKDRTALELADSICEGLEELKKNTEENLRLLKEARDKPEDKGSDSFLVTFISAKPPFELKEDGVYLGKRKVINKVIPVK